MKFEKAPLLLAIIWAGVILYFSIAVLPGAEAVSDKTMHLFAFFVLAALIYFSIQGSKHAVLHAMLFSLLYGIAMELMQTQIPWRTGSLGDVAADAIGIALVIGIHEAQNE